MSARVRILVLAITAVVVGSLWGVASAEAQTYQPRHEGIGIGIKSGPLFSSLSSNVSGNEFDNRTGWIGGLFIGGNRPGVLGAAMELLYARKGANDPNSSQSVTIDYFEIPLLLRINIGSNSLNGVNIYGVAGPSFDIRLKAKLNTGESLTDQTAGADIGFAAGAGIEITRFLIEGRYTRGLRNIATNELELGGKLNAHTVAIFFGIRFN